MSKDRWRKYRADGALPDARSIQAPQLAPRAAVRLPQRSDLRTDCSPIEDQGQLGSCAACAVVGAIEYVMRKSGSGNSDLSRLFVYYNARRMSGREAEDSGLPTTHAVASVLGSGACEERLWPYEAAKFAQKPPEQCYLNALTFLEVQYAQTPRGDPAKLALANGWPVVFRYFGPKEMLDAAGRTGRMEAWGQRPPAEQGMGHTMLIVGYDEDAKTVLVRNSWGTDYGDRGYMTIPYDVLENATNSFEYWTIGRIAEIQNARVEGPSARQSVEHTIGHAAEQIRESLAALRKDVRKELQENLDDSKKSIRDRLRAAEDRLGQKRDRDGGGNN